jgi:hypothetical protein
MLIYRPVRSNLLTQGFGENLACSVIGSWPPKIIGKYGSVCPVGSTDFYPTIGLDGHNGYDWATVKEEGVYFNIIADTKWRIVEEVDSAGGIVFSAYSESPVKVPEPEGALAKEHWDKNEGKLYVRFIYVHAKANIFNNDSILGPGAHIQVANSSGASGGNHVHFGMKYVTKEGITLDYSNGYRGYVDPSPFYRNQFILDALTEKAFLEGQMGSLVELHRQLEVAQLGFTESITQKIERILLTIKLFFNKR